MLTLLQILAVTLDNATSNDAAMTYIKRKLGEQNMLVANGILLHQRCCAHVLNLIVTSGLKMVKDIVDKVSKIVKILVDSNITWSALSKPAQFLLY